MIGRYETDPVLNDWHKVSVTQENSNFRWTNNAGVSWIMRPNFDQGKFILEQDCHYYDMCREVIIFPKFVKGKLNQNNLVDYLSFNGERYYKK